jgi:DNA-binding CsgD family transcriptional regulator
VDDILRRRPGLGTLVAETEALRSRITSSERELGFLAASALTAAELRVLPLLCTHLSFPRIAGEMYISRHTVKSQAMSIYRKLAVSCRAQAVAQARDLGLVDGWHRYFHAIGMMKLLFGRWFAVGLLTATRAAVAVAGAGTVRATAMRIMATTTSPTAL